MNTSNIGHEGEKVAVDYLQTQGYTILKTNFKAAGGEIDIIAKKGSHLAFVEVKTRRDTTFGYGGEFVNFYKQQKIINTARAFIMHYTDYEDISFDVCEVYTKERRINYIENAFTT